MSAFQESSRVILYRCVECRSTHAELKAGLEPQPLEDPRLTAFAPLPLNCPKCPSRLRYLYTTNDGDVLVYACDEHGYWHLGRGGLAPGSASR